MAPSLDVLIVGAGSTGLALAAQLERFGTRFRIIDRSLDRGRESRALAVQARTLELLDSVGLGQSLAARGRTSSRVVLHAGARTVGKVQLGDIGARDTRFPFILFISQSETERQIGEHLAAAGVTIERGVELTHFEQQNNSVACMLQNQDGREEQLDAAWLVGCDGAHSFVRKLAGFSFEGGTYPQDFVLADTEADGALEADALNAFVGNGGVALFFPLGEPATWRVIAMVASARHAPGQESKADSASPTGPLTLEELRTIVARPTDKSVTVHDPVWLTHFHLHHRQIAHYRNHRVFLAGDAAHVHSPVGGQGMNTGIQDAWNLGWKLGLVARGVANPKLLDSYEAERWPIGRFLLRFTDRLFTLLTRGLSAGRMMTWLPGTVMRFVPLLLASARLRKAAFRFVSELGIHYRWSPAVMEGEPALTSGPRAGDRLPDATLHLDGAPVALQRAAVGSCLTLLLCGDIDAWRTAKFPARGADLLRIIHLSARPAPGALVDHDGRVLAMLGVRDAAQYLIRPDGYIAFRCAGCNTAALEQYLNDWFPGTAGE
jgi:2-polyprenyl-6-methoxyphenol hydroxylase-like FAD-dependent oxidoreductase